MSKENFSLKKVSLTKSSPSVSLKKKGAIGIIKVNLNWNEGEKPGLIGKLFGGKKSIDLDLAAFVRLKDGSTHVIQALGDCFGNLNKPPYVQLLDDDRSGSSVDGEWLHVNGDKWNLVDEVLVYTFIYEGTANWGATDAVVTLHIPNESPIETCLTDGNNSKRLCAIARIVNDNDGIKVERINEFFHDQIKMDDAFNWGFKWTSGRK